MNHICLNISKSIIPSNYKGFGLYLQLQKSATEQSFGKWPLREINALKEALDFDEVVLLLGFDLLISVGLMVWTLYVGFWILTPELGFCLIEFE